MRFGRQAGSRRSSIVRDRRDGFTLVELLVVIALVAILASLLIPALNKAKAKGEGIACLGNLRQLQFAWTLYADDHEGQLVLNAGGRAINFDSWATGWMDWKHSPANIETKFLTETALGQYTSKTIGIYKCPSDKMPAENGPRVRSVSMNGFMGDHPTASQPNGIMSRLNPGYKIYRKATDLTQLPPSMAWVFVDEHPDSINDELFNVRMSPVDSHVMIWDDVPASYHNGACGFSFADGHAEIKRWQDEMTNQRIRRQNPSILAGMAASRPNNRDIRWLQERTTVPK